MTTNPYRRQLQQKLVEIGPNQRCGGMGRCPYFHFGITDNNARAMLYDWVLTDLIDCKPWGEWESWELLDLIDHLDGPVDFLVEP